MSKKPNILLIVIDTLRADMLGCYGQKKPTSPNIDNIAREGVVCENFFAPGIPTQPAFTTLFTGQHPVTHQIVTHGGNKTLATDASWLPTLLQKAGYTTCAIDNLARMKPWFQRGFEFYIDPSHREIMFINVKCETVNKRAQEWLKSHAEEQFFMLVHYWDPHAPYLPPMRFRKMFYDGDPFSDSGFLSALQRHPFSEIWASTWFKTLGRALGADRPISDPNYITAMYQGEIRYVDEVIGDLIKSLDRLGLTEDTLVIVTADHGESITEHNIFFEHYGLYRATLQVPMILRWPAGGLSGNRHLSVAMQQSDLAPTILDIAAVTRPPDMAGQSLLGHLRGERNEPLHQYIISQECTWQAKWSISDGDHKLIISRETDDLQNMPQRELYDLKNDPLENNNIYLSNWSLAEKLEGQFTAWLSQQLKRTNQTEDPLKAQGVTLGKNWREKLQALRQNQNASKL